MHGSVPKAIGDGVTVAVILIQSYLGGTARLVETTFVYVKTVCFPLGSNQSIMQITFRLKVYSQRNGERAIGSE